MYIGQRGRTRGEGKPKGLWEQCGQGRKYRGAGQIDMTPGRLRESWLGGSALF